MLAFAVMILIWMILWRVFILPYVRLRKFASQGIKTYFFPIIGKYFYCLLDALRFKDFYHEDKKIVASQKRNHSYAYNLGSSVCLHIADPDLIKELQENEKLFKKDEEILEYLFTLIGKGLVKQTGARWSSHRKIISKSLSFDAIQDMVPVIQELARKNFEKISNEELSNDFEIFPVFQNITSGVIMKLFFNENIEEMNVNGKPIERELGDIVNDVGEELLSFWNVLFGSGFLKKGYIPRHRALNKRITNFKEYCKSIVEARILKKKNADYIPRNDLLDSFIDSGAYELDEIVDELITFFLAGFETSSHALETNVCLLDIFGEWKGKINKNCDGKEVSGELAYEQLTKMDNLSAFVKESFRFIPPVTGTVHRVSDQDIKIGELDIPKSTKVRADMIYMHFNPEYYSNPNEFNPNRWKMSDCPKNPYGYMPFGYGPRKCVGQNLAILEIKVILHEFLKTFDFKIAEGYDMKLTLTTFYGLADRLKLKMRRKN